MTKKYIPVILTAAISMGLAGPAFADCASDIEQVNAALAAAAISSDDRATIEATTMAAEAKMNAGDEAGCEEDLAAVKSVLHLN